ncbi:MAG: TetR family transcriptional regulator [Chloroflexi bacterium]|nr:TetR family transcriptional regulator [Chloroflexota bacterium]
MTKQKILNAAAQIFGKKGYHATSMQDIADSVNLKKASLYHHIDSKQEILRLVLEQALDLVIDRVIKATEKDIPAPQKLRLSIRNYLQTLADNQELAAVLLLEYRSLLPELNHIHIPHRDRFEGLWRNLIQEILESGNFHNTDPDVATRALLGMMNWAITWYRQDGSYSPEQIADQFTDLILNGLMIPESTLGS